MTGKALKDVLVVGYGAVGAIQSMILKQSGKARVTAVARGNYEAVLKNGMNFKSQKYPPVYGFRPDRLLPSVSAAADRPYAYVVLTTKVLPSLNPTTKILAPLLEEGYVRKYKSPTYVLVQNGVGVERGLAGALGMEGKDKGDKEEGKGKIISTAMFIYSNFVKPEGDEVEMIDYGRLVMGMYNPTVPPGTLPPPISAQDKAILEEFAEMVRGGGGEAQVVDDIQREKYTKNFWNLAFSSIATLTRLPVTTLFQNADVEEVILGPLRGLLTEYLSVVRAMGFSDCAKTGIPSSVVDRAIESTRAFHVRKGTKHKASMLYDLEVGKPLELEVIVGEVVRRARALGVDVPRIEMLYALLYVVQSQLIKGKTG